MKFAIAILNFCNMTPLIRTRTLVNARWDAVHDFSIERRLTAWETAHGLLRPINEGVTYLRAVIDVFYDGLRVPGDQTSASGGHVVVTLGYALTGAALQGYVGIEKTQMLHTTCGQVVQIPQGYFCDVTISPQIIDLKPLPDFGLPAGGLR